MESIEECPKSTNIQEGSATILGKGNVFYNPVQEFNRDFSVVVLSTYSRLFTKNSIPKNPNDDSNGKIGLRILEALSATGLRSIRYAKEVPNIKEIIANDLSKVAIESIIENIKFNNVEHLISPSLSDAMILMYLSSVQFEKQYDVIDLDPYGSPTRFLDGAVQCIRDGGLLAVTATDMAVLAGGTPETCYVKYGAIPLKTKACHEMALRILLKCIECNAIRYGKYIKPLLSISADFYVRVFVQVFKSPVACKQSSSKQSMIYQCTGCDTLTLQPLGITKINDKKNIKFGIPTGPQVNSNCEHCGHRHHMGGPIWSAPIHDVYFLQEIFETLNTEQYKQLSTYSRIFGMLSVIDEELHDVPLYYTIDKMCSILKLEVIPMLKFRSALLHANYLVSLSHASKLSIKTNAPAKVLWDILRCWAKIHPVKEKRFIDGTPLKAILSQEPSEAYNLIDIHLNANPDSRKKAFKRFPVNPEANWGPGMRATLMIGENKMLKSIRNQNKRKNWKESTNCENDEIQNKQLKLDCDDIVK